MESRLPSTIGRGLRVRNERDGGEKEKKEEGEGRGRREREGKQRERQERRKGVTALSGGGGWRKIF